MEGASEQKGKIVRVSVFLPVHSRTGATFVARRSAQTVLPVFLRPVVCAALLAAAVLAQPVAERPAEVEARVAALGAELLARYGMAPPPAGKEAAPRAVALSALELARDRAEALVALIRDAPARALEAALPAEALDELRARNPDLAPHLEQRGEWEGAAALIVADDFERGRSWEFHLLETPQGDALEAYGVSVGRGAGGRMRVSGIALRGRIAVREAHPAPAAEPQNPELVPQACNTIGEQKTAVYLVYRRGVEPPAISAAQVRELVFGAEISLDYHIRKMSFGQAWLSGEVLTPRPVELDIDDGRLPDVPAVERATGLANLGDRFQRHIFVISSGLLPGGSGGLGTLGCYSSNTNTAATSSMWVLGSGRGAYGTRTYIHEFGHNLGLNHAREIREDGIIGEYGDYSNLMGGQVPLTSTGRGYFSAQHLLGIGWINEDNIVTVDEDETGVRSYALKWPHAEGGQPPGSSPVALRIRRKPRIEDDEQWLPRRITGRVNVVGTSGTDALDPPIDLGNEEQWLWVEGQSRLASSLDYSDSELHSSNYGDRALVRVESPSLSGGGAYTHVADLFHLEAEGHLGPNMLSGQMPAGRTWEDPNSPLSLRVEFTADGLTVFAWTADEFPLITTNGIALATGTPVVGHISPNALVSVFGRYFAPEGTRALTPELNAAGGVADNLAGICLEIAGERVPLFAVFAHQINAQAPHGLTPGRAQVDVIRGCGTTGEWRGLKESVAVAPVSPAFFNFVSNPDGRNPVVALHGGGPALVGPPGAVAGAALTPAAPGEIVTLFGTGFGPTESALEAGRIPGVPAPLAGEVSFYFGSVEPPLIETVAGAGSPYYGGDGGPATAAYLFYPAGVALDGAGNLYIADLENSRIRKVDAAGVITTVAGDGRCCYSGDGGAAVAARLSSPRGVAVDGAGNLYIADTRNNRIRKVDAAGVITTVAGTGTEGFGGDGGPAVAAQLNRPTGVASDGLGNLYIADWGNHRIRKVDAAGVITTVAGTGPTGEGEGGFGGDGGAATAAQLNRPFGVAVDGAGNLYIADNRNHRIRKVDAAGVITTVAGTGNTWGFGGDGGAATAAQLAWPRGVAVDGAGNLYIADGNHRIRKVDAGDVITTVAGTGTFSYTGAGRGFGGDGGAATAARLSSPSGVAPDGAGNLYIADTENQRIRRVSARFKRNSHAAPLYAGAAPCCAGLYQFTVRLPDDLPDGNVSVIAAVQGVPTPPGPFLAIQRR